MFKANLFAGGHFAPAHFSHGAVVIIIDAAAQLIHYVSNISTFMNR